MADDWTEIATRGDNRTVRVIQADAYSLVETRIRGAIDVADGVTLHHLADALKEIAERFRFHEAKRRQAEVSRFAMNGHSEREPR